MFSNFVFDSICLVMLSDVRLTIHPGDRIGLLGHNGAGKSTLIKVLASELKVLSGKFTEAKELNIGYFAQHQLEQLDFDASPLLHLQRLDAKATESDLRKYLGGFNFHNDMAIDPVAPLSGGEKALTAVAFVFAIFRLNPAPFCLLDEVDAPLDDANVSRFTAMVKEMSGTVQFIVVTHNKITMEISQHLTGVTMHEPGVSRLVAVDVEAAAELASA